MASGSMAGTSARVVPVVEAPVPVPVPIPAARNLGIDAFRFGLAFLVIVLHALPGLPQLGWVVPMQIACRSAVPFFFIASGYFLPREPRSIVDAVRKPVLRLAPVYVFWMAVYFLYFEVNPVGTLISSPKDFLNGGGAFHLWFLPALGFGLAMVGLGMRIAGPRITGLACLAVALAGLAGGCYAGLIEPGAAGRRGGLLMAPLLVFIGHMTALHGLRMKPLHALGFFALSNVLLVAEEITIRQATHAPQLLSHDFVASTFPLGLSVFLLAQSLPGTPLVARLAGLGKLSMGIYLAHLTVLFALSRVMDRASLAEVLILAPLTLVLTALLVAGLRKSRLLARFVA